MTSRLFPLYFLILLLPIAVSCTDRPDNVPSDSKMVKIMADMEMAQAYLQSKGRGENSMENREKILNYVLRKNGMTREDFDSTLAWYGRHIDIYDDLYAKVDKELARRESKISGNSVEMLSTDLWPYSRHLVISSKSSANNLAFSIPTTEIEKGDRLTWKFRLNTPSEGTALLGVRYSDGSASYTSQTLNGDNIEVFLQTDTSRIVRDIYGNLRVNLSRSFVGLDSLSLSSAPYDSTIYYRINTSKRYFGPKLKVKKPEIKDSIPSDKDSI